MLAHAVARKALPVLFLLAALPGFFTGAAVANPQSADVRVIFWVDRTLDASYVSNVMLTNMTPDPIDSWTLGFDLDPAANNIRNAGWSASGTRHTVNGAGWTRKIPAGQSIWFSIDGTIPGGGSAATANDVPLPTGCSFNGQVCSFERLTEPGPNQHDTLAVDVGWWVASKGITEYRAQILLKNVTTEPVNHWKLRFQSTSLITSIDHGDFTRTGANYEVTGKGWTKSIKPDEMVWLTLRGVHTGQVDTLKSCIFNGFPCEFVDPDDFVEAPEEPEVPDRLCAALPDPDEKNVSNSKLRFDFQLGSLWPTGYTYNIEVINNSDKAVRDWTLNFTLNSDMTIERMWNADWRRSGSSYTVTPLPHTNCIEPGDSITFGFEGKHNANPVQPGGCQFNGNDCTFARFSGTSTGVEDAHERPENTFHLGAAYPNPFAVHTTIPFRVEETQEVHVTLWDMQGRQVTSLHHGMALGGQTYEISVPAGSLNSGVYMIRLTGASGAGVTAPVMLVR